MRKIKADIDKKRLLATLAIALLVLLCKLTPAQRASTLTIVPAEQSSQVWITNILIDGQDTSLAERPLSNGWVYREEWDDILSDPSGWEPLQLEFASAQKIELRFIETDPSFGHFEDGDKACTPAFYSKFLDDVGSYYMVQSNIFYIFVDNPILFFSALAVLWVILYWAFGYRKKNSKMFGFLYVLLFMYTFIFHSNVNFDKSLIATLTVAAVLVALNWPAIASDPRVTVYQKPHAMILIGIVSAYAVFSLVGRQIFLSQIRSSMTLSGMSLFLLITLLFYPAIVSMMYGLERISELVRDGKGKPHPFLKKYAPIFIEYPALLFFLCACVPLLIAAIGYYPANITSDGVDQWAQALGVEPLQDAHPVLHTLFLRLCSLIGETPFTVIIVHILAYSVLLSCFMCYFHQKGAPLVPLAIFSFAFSALPCNYAMVTLMSKNITFALCILWFIYLLLRISNDPVSFFKKPLNIAVYSVCIALIYLFRHNAFVILLAAGIIALCLTITHWNQIKVRAFVPLIIACVLIGCVKYPLMRYLGIEPASTKTVMTPLITPFGAAAAAQLPLPDEMTEYMDVMLPLEEWASAYGTPYRSFLGIRLNSGDISLSESMGHYLDLLQMYPDVVIKDRLDATDILWDITQPSGGQNNRYAVGMDISEYFAELLPDLAREEWYTPYGYRWDNALAKILNQIIAIPGRYQIFDAVMWRNGVYLTLSLILLVYGILHKRRFIIYSLLTLYLMIATYFLTIAYQIFQYSWFFSLGTSFIFFVALVDSVSDTRKDKKRDKPAKIKSAKKS